MTNFTFEAMEQKTITDKDREELEKAFYNIYYPVLKSMAEEKAGGELSEEDDFIVSCLCYAVACRALGDEEFVKKVWDLVGIIGGLFEAEVKNIKRQTRDRKRLGDTLS